MERSGRMEEGLEMRCEGEDIRRRGVRDGERGGGSELGSDQDQWKILRIRQNDVDPQPQHCLQTVKGSSTFQPLSRWESLLPEKKTE